MRRQCSLAQDDAYIGIDKAMVEAVVTGDSTSTMDDSASLHSNVIHFALMRLVLAHPSDFRWTLQGCLHSLPGA
jgi:hypothetical protein